MSVAELKLLIVEKLESENDISTLDRIVHILEEKENSQVSMKEVWAEITSRHDGLMKRLAE